MPKHWQRGEGTLQPIEGIRGFGHQNELVALTVLTRERIEWKDRLCIVVNKATVKVCKTEEGLNILDRLRCRPVRDCRELAGAHLDTIRTKPKAKVLDFWLVEGTLLRICKEPRTLESFKNHLDMLVMLLLGPGEDEDVIDVHDAHHVKQVAKSILDKTLKDTGVLHQNSLA